jgi:hypothetical protein
VPIAQPETIHDWKPCVLQPDQVMQQLLTFQPIGDQEESSRR